MKSSFVELHTRQAGYVNIESRISIPIKYPWILNYIKIDDDQGIETRITISLDWWCLLRIEKYIDTHSKVDCYYIRLLPYSYKKTMIDKQQ